MSSFPEKLTQLRQSGKLFSPTEPIFYNRAPGRLDLMGGNDDYTGGLVFEATIREATWAAVQPRSDRLLRFSNPQMAAKGWRELVEFSLDDLTNDKDVRAIVNRDPALRWTAYVLGN